MTIFDTIKDSIGTFRSLSAGVSRYVLYGFGAACGCYITLLILKLIPALQRDELHFLFFCMALPWIAIFRGYSISGFNLNAKFRHLRAFQQQAELDEPTYYIESEKLLKWYVGLILGLKGSKPKSRRPLESTKDVFIDNIRGLGLGAAAHTVYGIGFGGMLMSITTLVMHKTPILFTTKEGSLTMISFPFVAVLAAITHGSWFADNVAKNILSLRNAGYITSSQYHRCMLTLFQWHGGLLEYTEEDTPSRIDRLIRD